MTRPRSHDLDMALGTLEPGPLDAITDVDGIKVGSVTLIEGDGPLRRGEGPVRTGVTVVVPHEGSVPLFAGCHRLNGNGELTGLEWIREAGCLTTPIGLTNTHSVGVVRDALVEAEVRQYDIGEMFWSLPVVGETWDGSLNDINGFHVRAEHVHEALARASHGPVEEGGVGSGTGMICHGFKGGLGTASRRAGEWTVGVLVQANHGRRDRLAVGGFPVGRVLGPDVVPLPDDDPAVSGSIIVVCATDAPLLPHQCDRLAQRCALGIARTGGAGEHSSGDLVLAFSTVRQGVPPGEGGWARISGEPDTISVRMLVDAHMDPLFYAAIEATEAAIINALLAAETMIGRDGITAHALTAERLLDAIYRVRRG
jgi:D-aminopeptidase